MGNFLLRAEMGVTASVRARSERGYPRLRFSEGKLPQAVILLQPRRPLHFYVQITPAAVHLQQLRLAQAEEKTLVFVLVSLLSRYSQGL